MSQQIVGLCDSNPFYAGRLIQFLEEQKSFPYHVMLFSEPIHLETYCREHTLSYLILSEDLYSEEVTAYGLRRIFLLQKEQRAQTESESDAADICRIYRYQSAVAIMHQLMAEIAELTPTNGTCLLEGGRTRLIGVYTPIGRCMQTTFSLLLGQLLTQKGRTLYLNMEGYSGLRILLKRESGPDITDLAYYTGRDPMQFIKRMENMVDTIGGLEYIPPAAAYMDLSMIEAAQWTRMFGELEESGRFSYLVLDLTEQVQGLFDLLQRCDIVYTIETPDAIGAAKLQEYTQLLTITDHTEILQKTRKLTLPSISQNQIDFEQLVYSELADYVKQIVREDFGG